MCSETVRRGVLYFQFFPSCCERRTWSAATRCAWLTRPFNSFPVAARGRRRGARAACSRCFQFFPSCCAAESGGRGDRGTPDAHLSILSQLLQKLLRNLSRMLQYTPFNSFPVAAAERTQSEPANLVEAFNSFPVAAEALASWLLINLSSANFEVHEISLALPPDACSNSRKPFPDSRRKEGIWRERNRV